MLCSRCSEKIRPIVACDIDGVLGNYHSHFHKFMAGYLGLTPSQLGRLNGFDGTISHREWMEACGVSTEEFRAIKLAYRQGSQKRTMPPFLGAVETLKRLKANTSIELWLTTTRPYLRLDNIDPDTRYWVEKFSIPFDYMLYDEYKYPKLAERVDPHRVVAVIDDEEEMLRQAGDSFGSNVPIQYRTNFNMGVDWTPFATGGRDLWMAVKERVEQWERERG
jgi:hypothetical protein